MSDNEELRNKEIEIIEIFLDNFIKECDCEGLSIFDVKEDSGVYYIEWMTNHPSIEYYDKGIEGFLDYINKYKSMVEILKEKVSSLR